MNYNNQILHIHQYTTQTSLNENAPKKPPTDRSEQTLKALCKACYTQNANKHVMFYERQREKTRH